VNISKRNWLLLALMTFFALPLMACESEEYVSGNFTLHPLFYAQNQDEFLQVMLEAEPVMEVPEYAIPELLEMLNESGRPIEDYMEDLVFLASLLSEYLSNVPSGYLEDIRKGFEDFYHMNDFVFLSLLSVTAHDLGILQTEIGDLPFLVVPYAGTFSWQNFNDYVITPNRTMVIIYDFR